MKEKLKTLKMHSNAMFDILMNKKSKKYLLPEEVKREIDLIGTSLGYSISLITAHEQSLRDYIEKVVENSTEAGFEDRKTLAIELLKNIKTDLQNTERLISFLKEKYIKSDNLDVSEYTKNILDDFDIISKEVLNFLYKTKDASFVDEMNKRLSEIDTKLKNLKSGDAL